jgi:hypothetical protein
MIQSFHNLQMAFEAFVAEKPETLNDDEKIYLTTQIATIRHRITNHFGKLHKKLNVKTRREYNRIATFTLEEGFELLNSADEQLVLNGESINIKPSLRLLTFMTKGLQCSFPRCKLEASYFAAERSYNPATANNPVKPEYAMYSKYHLNLYGRTPTGKEILFTHDHILARALGGSDTIDNAQTMCEPHNALKAKRENLIVQLRRLEIESACERCNGTTVIMHVPTEGNISTMSCPNCILPGSSSSCP